jgi:hypothetical protein
VGEEPRGSSVSSDAEGERFLRESVFSFPLAMLTSRCKRGGDFTPSSSSSSSSSFEFLSLSNKDFDVEVDGLSEVDAFLCGEIVLLGDSYLLSDELLTGDVTADLFGEDVPDFVPW